MRPLRLQPHIPIIPSLGNQVKNGAQKTQHLAKRWVFFATLSSKLSINK